MATLDSFREATGEPIQLDLANGYIADIRLNAGDINGRTITVELTEADVLLVIVHFSTTFHLVIGCGMRLA